MGPVEYLFLALWLVFGVVGWVRGFLKELGVTFVIIATLLGLTALSGRLDPILDGLGARKNLLGAAVYVGILLFATLISYHGVVLDFKGKAPGGCVGELFGAFVGLLNGYLVIGSVWYYLHKFGYPLVGVRQPFSTLAKDLMAILPFNFIPQMYWREALLAALLFLLFLRVVR